MCASCAQTYETMRSAIQQLRKSAALSITARGSLLSVRWLLVSSGAGSTAGIKLFLRCPLTRSGNWFSFSASEPPPMERAAPTDPAQLPLGLEPPGG